MERRTFLRATAAALATLGCSASNSREHEEGNGEVSTSDELASLAKATAWINSPALTAASVRGRVVLVQFCTFTCVNWLRTLPYARAWAEKYRDAGLIVIGAHTPEFSFEHDLANVQRALRDMRVTYPIAVDNESAIVQSGQQLRFKTGLTREPQTSIPVSIVYQQAITASPQTLVLFALDEAKQASGSSGAGGSLTTSAPEASSDWTKARCC